MAAVVGPVLSGCTEANVHFTSGARDVIQEDRSRTSSKVGTNCRPCSRPDEQPFQNASEKLREGCGRCKDPAEVNSSPLHLFSPLPRGTVVRWENYSMVTDSQPLKTKNRLKQTHKVYYCFHTHRRNPNDTQTTPASTSSHPSSHTVPHRLPTRISTLPSLFELPPTKRTGSVNKLIGKYYLGCSNRLWHGVPNLNKKLVTRSSSWLRFFFIYGI